MAPEARRLAALLPVSSRRIPEHLLGSLSLCSLCLCAAHEMRMTVVLAAEIPALPVGFGGLTVATTVLSPTLPQQARRLSQKLGQAQSSPLKGTLKADAAMSRALVLFLRAVEHPFPGNQ